MMENPHSISQQLPYLQRLAYLVDQIKLFSQKLETLQTLNGHTNQVLGVAVMPNGNVVSASYDKTLKVWDPNTGQCLQTLNGHADLVLGVAVMPNGNVISVSEDRTLKVWDPNTGQCLQTLNGHKNAVWGAAVMPNGNVVSASKDQTLKVWALNTGQCLQILNGHTNTVCGVAVMPNGNVVSASCDDTLKVWDFNTGQCLQTLNGHTRGVYGVAVMPNGNVVSASLDRTLKVWDPNTGQCLQTLNGHTSGVYGVAVMPNGNVVSVGGDRTLKIWDPNTGQCLQTLNGHTDHVWSVAVMPNGNVVSASSDQTLKVWHLFYRELANLVLETLQLPNEQLKRLEAIINQKDQAIGELQQGLVNQGNQLAAIQESQHTLRQQHEALAVECNQHERKIDELQYKIKDLQVIAVKNAYEGLDKQAVKVQAVTRGFFTRKQEIMPRLLEQRKHEVLNNSSAVMSKLAQDRKFQEISKLGMAIDQQRWHDAIQIMRGIPEREFKIGNNNNRSIRY